MPYEENNYISTVHEPTDANYEKAEMDQLKKALSRTYTERFQMMTRLMKMNIMFKRAKITRQLLKSPFPSPTSTTL